MADQFDAVAQKVKELKDAGRSGKEIDAFVEQQGLTRDQFLQERARREQQAARSTRTVGDVPMEALQNLPASAKEEATNIVQPVLHPVSTLQNIIDLPTGAIREGAKALLPEETFKNYDEYLFGPKEEAERVSQTAKNVGNYYADRYGSMEGFLEAVATHPLSVVGDVGTVLSGGTTLATKIPALSKAARMANVLNPVNAVTKPLEVAGKVIGKPVKSALGLTTGAGGDAVQEAYRTGRHGTPEQGEAFRANMRGHEGQEAAVAEARVALGKMKEQRRQQYQADMRSTKADQTPIDFDPVVNAFNDVWDQSFHNGHQRVSDEAMGKLKKIGGILEEWQKDPASHTAGGLDALKHRIDQEMPNFTEPGNTERIVTVIRNAVKDQIVKQVPEYAKAMKGYEELAAAETELQKSLGLGSKTSVDSTLRRLQSIFRNNVNTNYGSRTRNVERLETAGADTIKARLAGQAMSSATPRGLQALLAGGLSLAPAVMSGQGWLAVPKVAAAVASTSPRLVGEAAHAAGRAAKHKVAAALAARLMGNEEAFGGPR